MASVSKVIFFEEVVKNKERSKCWLLISGKVYDVTEFLEEHPGGDEVLLAAAGKDATDDFIDIGHSDDAKKLMGKYYIGEIDSATVLERNKHRAPRPVQTPYKPEGSGFMVKVLQFVVPLLILGLAFAFQYLGKKEKKEN